MSDLRCTHVDGNVAYAVARAVITRNALKCLSCEKVIESTSRHDYKTCGCSNGAMVDGGSSYLRWGAVDVSLIESLATHGPPPDLVALTEPCATCGGERKRSTTMIPDVISGMLTRTYDCPNPDCFDGHRRITVEVPCPNPQHGNARSGYCLRCDIASDEVGYGYVERTGWLEPLLLIVAKPSDGNGRPFAARTSPNWWFLAPSGTINPSEGGTLTHLLGLNDAEPGDWLAVVHLEARR